MSCRDWASLLAHRFDPAVATPADWQECEEHLAACEACRREAVALDPTLAFRAAATWVPEAEEAASIRLAVRTLRRASTLTADDSRGLAERRSRVPRAAAALFALLLILHPSTTARNPARSASSPRAGLLRVAGSAAPAIEGVDRPDARVYEWGAEDLSVVMVIDESLDV